MINTLSTISSESSFSIVPFATNAELVSSLVSADEALDSLDAITFTGGRTNHAAAIISCRTSLESSPESDRKNLLLLITDGSPSEPEGLPGFAADIAAADAKSVGIFIIPTTIKQEVSPYLQRMSSDGAAFYASDFDVVDSLQEILLAQVSCQV
jgi:Mg-chelatase subunit ChlD